MSQSEPLSFWDKGNLAPVRKEITAFGLPVIGDLPRELSGTLYRNGPNPQFEPRGHHHWFAGDGMVHAFRIEAGGVSYRNRWLRTPKFEWERAQGRAVFGAFGNPTDTDPAALGKDFGVANTNVVSHGGRLLALEESHLPFAFDPLTLESHGYHDFGGALPRTLEGRFTAHPKIDPVTGDMFGYSYSGSGLFDTRMSLIVIGADGALRRRAFFDAPYCAFVHDFLLTDRHIVFPILPVVGSMDRARAGAPPYAWEGNRPGYLGVLERDAPIETLRWFEVEPCYVFHVFNAWSEGNRVFCDVMHSKRTAVFPDVDGRMPPPNRQPADAGPMDSRSRRDDRRSANRISIGSDRGVSTLRRALCRTCLPSRFLHIRGSGAARIGTDFLREWSISTCRRVTAPNGKCLQETRSARLCSCLAHPTLRRVGVGSSRSNTWDRRTGATWSFSMRKRSIAARSPGQR